GDVLAHLRNRRLHDLADRHLRIADRRLIEQTHLLVEAIQLSLDDLLDYRGRLVLAFHLRAVNAALALEDVRGDLLAAYVLRTGGRGVHRDFLRQALEVLGPRHEVRLAVDLDEHADLAAHVDVAADEAFVGRPSRLLRGLREPAFAEDGGRLLDVA